MSLMPRDIREREHMKVYSAIWQYMTKLIFGCNFIVTVTEQSTVIQLSQKGDIPRAPAV